MRQCSCFFIGVCVWMWVGGWVGACVRVCDMGYKNHIEAFREHVNVPQASECTSKALLHALFSCKARTSVASTLWRV